MFIRILFGALLCCSLASAERVAIPLDKVFLNLPAFDELDVVLLSAGRVFADVSPLDLTGLGTDLWSSSRDLDGQQAIAIGPEVTGISSLTMNLVSRALVSDRAMIMRETGKPVSKTPAVQVRVLVKFHGGEVRVVLMTFDGSNWVISGLPPNGVPQVVVPADNGNSGDPVLGPIPPPPIVVGPGGPPPTEPVQPTSVPEPSLANVAGLALLALVVGARRRQAAARPAR